MVTCVFVIFWSGSNGTPFHPHVSTKEEVILNFGSNGGSSFEKNQRHACDTTVKGLASTVVLGAPAKRMRSFSLSTPSMPLEEETPKRPPEDSFSCVSVDSEIVDQGEATEGQSCRFSFVTSTILIFYILT